MRDAHEYFKLNRDETVSVWSARDGGRLILPDRSELPSSERPSMRQIAAARKYKSENPRCYRRNGVGIWQER